MLYFKQVFQEGVDQIQQHLGPYFIKDFKLVCSRRLQTLTIKVKQQRVINTYTLTPSDDSEVH